MRNELNILKSIPPQPTVGAFFAASVLALAAYIGLYQYAPLETPLNDIALNSIVSFSALTAALIATAIYRLYQPHDRPRRVWANVMIASWLWFLGELTRQIYAYAAHSDIPAPNLADAWRTGGFLFFTLAFYHQYAIIAPAQKDTIRTFAIGAWLVAMLIPAVYLSLTDSFSPDHFIQFCYPFADLAAAAAGLALAFTVRGGALMRSWLGLALFGFSDLLYAWAEKANHYAAFAENGSIISLAIDTTCLAAYLILGGGFLGHWLGMQTQPEIKPPRA